MNCLAEEYITRLKSVVVALGGIITGVGIILLVFMRIGYGVPCVFRVITGLLCPGCGMTHALIALIHGNFIGAFQYNVLSVTVCPLLLVYMGIRVFRFIHKGITDFSCPEILFLFFCLVVCGYYFFQRNNLI